MIGPQQRTPWGQHALASSLYFVLGAEMFVLSPVLPALARDFEVSTAVAALTVSAFALTYALTSPLMGVLADRFTRKTAILSGTTLFVLGGLLGAMSPSFGVLICGRVLAGVGGAMLGPAVWSFVTETASPRQRGRAVSRVSVFFSAGQIVGVPVGALLAALWGWRWVFGILAGAMAIAGILIAARFSPERRRPPKKVSLWSGVRSSFGLWAQRGFVYVVTSNFFAQAARYASYTFAGALALQRFGMETAALGLFGALAGVGALIGSLLTGALVDRFHSQGRNQFRLSVGYGLVMASGLLAATAAPVLWASMAGWVLTFAAGAGFVSTNQEYLTSAMGERRAAAVSWNNAALYAGTAAGTLLLGFTRLGGWGFTVLAMTFAVIAAVLSFVSLRHGRRL